MNQKVLTRLVVKEAVMIRSILYATDLGLYAHYVLQHALAQARGFNADLYVVHAIEPVGLLADSVLRTYLNNDQLADLRQEGLAAVLAGIETKVMDGFREELDGSSQDARLIREVRAVQGDPPDVIAEQAQAYGVDLIVIGTHSYGGERITPIGRTAQRVLHASTVPVYVVPIPTQHRA
jgi:nucleotide-binding universal stress UspA family protein